MTGAGDLLQHRGTVDRQLDPADPDPAALAALQAASFAGAGPGLRQAYPEDRRLSGPELAALLSRPGRLVVSSSRPDGRPRSTPVSFLFAAGRFWLPTGAGAARARDVAHTPWLALALSEGGADRHRAVLVEGPAAVVAAADLPGEVRRRAAALRMGGDWAAVWLRVEPHHLVSYASPGWSPGPAALTDPPGGEPGS